MSDEENCNVSSGSNYSPQQRKAFYRKYLGQTKILQENVDKQTIFSLDNIMVNTDTIIEDEPNVGEVKGTDEVLLDSEVISVSSDVLNRCTVTLSEGTSPYSHVEFADKILSFVQMRPDTVLEEPHWPILIDEVFKCLNITPRYSYLLGTLKPLEKKPIVKRKQGKREGQVAIKRPENVQAVEKVEDGVEETVQKIKALVSQYYKNNGEPLDFFKLVLNPGDFGRTVENMLHVSFPIRDGFFSLLKDDEGRLIIKSTSKEALARANKQGNDANVQNVMSISVQQWQTLKEAYKLNQPMINFGTSGRT